MSYKYNVKKKRNINENICIIVLAVIAIFIIILYLYSKECLEKANEILDLGYGLAISYLAVTIFYILQVMVPRHKNKQRAILANKDNFINIIKFIEMVALVVEKYFIVEDGYFRINWNGSCGEKRIYFSYSWDGDRNSLQGKSFSDSDFININKTYRDLLGKIKESSYFSFFGEKELELISKLDSLVFFDLLPTKVNIDRRGRELLHVDSGNNELKSVLELAEELKQLMGINNKIQIFEPKIESVAADKVMRRDGQNITLEVLNVEVKRELYRITLDEERKNGSISDSEWKEGIEKIDKMKAEDFFNMEICEEKL